MPKSNKNQRDGLIEFQSTLLKQKLYWLLFLILAVTPILAVNAFRGGERIIPLLAMILWGVAFTKAAMSSHERGIISYRVSLPCAALILIASFFY
jgi:hypothetical protein